MRTKIFVLIILLVTLFNPGRILIYFFLPVILYFMLLDSGLFRFILKRQFLFFVFILLLLQPLLTGSKEFSIFSINFSLDTFYNGLLMILRSLIIISSISCLLINSDKRKIQNLFNKIGINNFDKMFSYSVELLPLMKKELKKFAAFNKKKIFLNPIEVTAQFIALLLVSSKNLIHKTRGGGFYDE